MDKSVLNASIFNKHDSLGKIMKFFFSISLFSLLVACSLSLSFIFYPFDFHFSTLLLSFFTNIFQRKFVFLIFNGILAFLAKKSGIISSSSSSSSTFESEDSASEPSKLEELDMSKEDGNAALVEVEDENTGDVHEEEPNREFLHTEERVGGALALGEEENFKDERYDSSVVETAVEEESRSGSVTTTEDVDVSEEFSSTEELNRKFEEFIRKMKEELRVEAQQQLIAAA